MPFTQIRVEGRYFTGGIPFRGKVTFIPTEEMTNDDEVSNARYSAQLNQGRFVLYLPATDDEGTAPSSVSYKVVEELAGLAIRIWYLAVPNDSGTIIVPNDEGSIDSEVIGDLVPIIGPPPPLPQPIPGPQGEPGEPGEDGEDGEDGETPDVNEPGIVDDAIKGIMELVFTVGQDVRAVTQDQIPWPPSGPMEVDGVECVPGDRVLVYVQTDKTVRGFYRVREGTWDRDVDQIVTGYTTRVLEGTVGGGRLIMMTTTGMIVIGTTELDWIWFDQAIILAMIAFPAIIQALVTIGELFEGLNLEDGIVTTVNGQTGTVTITAEDVDALPLIGGTITGDLEVNGELTQGGAPVATKAFAIAMAAALG